ncbi:sensor domain-containing protein [Actinospica sp. MGRD01-02]|uniref:histidine kinase n=1 Tax=Actinospica acidithermotolerans TaxID=2828514 RepID=A0A941IHH3_9ACTN|nr:sensor histidine kinase [Actinospica acidithermotolerans]MBR7825717.1 sensor domain-containing protein [Actinospica acidithermotolerans]
MSSGITHTETRARALRSVLAGPWGRRAWRDLGFTVLSAGLNLLPLLVMALPWILFPPISFLAVLTCAFVSVAAAVALCPWLTVLRRGCFYEVLGVRIPKPPTIERSPESSGGVWSALRDHLRSPRTWRQACYHLVVGPAVNLLGLLGALAWGAALTYLATSAVFWVLVHVFGMTERLVWAGAELWIVLLCAILVYLGPWIVSVAVRVDARAASELLGPSRAEQLAQRVAKLTESRAGALDAADVERRRIERDLHDGAQQRLVSLAMNLGLARATLADELSEPARRALQEAHEEAKEALTELRELVRGLHPVVLEDRGLDAALSGIAARSPVPVRLTVDVPRRVSSTVEAVGYFIVSEALANANKHARATAVQVDVRLDGTVLRITVTDDGIGGAQASRGTGLTGLAQRAASVDGSFGISSPLGGPTTIKVDLPCEP